MKDIFCVKEQETTPHEGKIDVNGEFLFTCSTEDCGSFIKFPADTTPEKLDELIALEAETNQGQVSVEKQEATLKAMLGEDTEDKKDEENETDEEQS